MTPPVPWADLVLTFALAALSIAVVTSPRIFRAAIYLMGVLVVTAAVYVRLGAEFLAGIQLLVYVGGIVVLIVFAVMLTSNVEVTEAAPSLVRRTVATLIAAGFFATTTYALMLTPLPAPGPGAWPADNTAALGHALLDTGAGGYILPFEIVSLLLLAAVLGGIVVARRSPVKRPAAAPPAQPRAETEVRS